MSASEMVNVIHHLIELAALVIELLAVAVILAAVLLLVIKRGTVRYRYHVHGAGDYENYKHQLGKAKYRATYSSLVFATVLLLAAVSSAMAQNQPPLRPAAGQSDVQITKDLKETDTRKKEIDLLKTQLATQQAELTELKKAVEEQSKLILRLLQNNTDAAASIAKSTSDGSGATASDARSAGPTTTDQPMADRPFVGAVPLAQPEKPSPLSFKIGTAHFTPFGFFDFTAILRDKNVGSNIATNFGAIPFNNTVNGNLREYRFSAQSVRMGLRVDTKVGEADLLGYLETDFQGFAPGNVAVTSNSDTLRLRLGFVDLRKNKLEVLAGQSWTMLTPNRKGLSPLPADLFLTQGMDSNLHVGLTWSRNPQFRLIYHASETVTLGWSIEASEQYGGGAGGSGAITLPSNLVSAYGSQLNTGSSTFAVPNSSQDNIVKIAFDPKFGKRAVHFEVAGLLSRFAFFNPLSNKHFNASGGGVALNGNVELAKNFRLIGNTFYSSGGGRWIFGQGPDLIIRGDGSPELVGSASTIDGIEYQATPKTVFYAYYGGAYFEKAIAIDPANGNEVGFGYTGSPSNHNRSIQQGTFGFTHTFWRDPNYGAMQFMTQYSYLVRHPWHVAPGQPGSANLNMLFLNLRYLLPGAPPTAQK